MMSFRTTFIAIQTTPHWIRVEPCGVCWVVHGPLHFSPETWVIPKKLGTAAADPRLLCTLDATSSTATSSASTLSTTLLLCSTCLMQTQRLLHSACGNVGCLGVVQVAFGVALSQHTCHAQIQAVTAVFE
jgi:hypothetical protein